MHIGWVNQIQNYYKDSNYNQSRYRDKRIYRDSIEREKKITKMVKVASIFCMGVMMLIQIMLGCKIFS